MFGFRFGIASIVGAALAFLSAGIIASSQQVIGTGCYSSGVIGFSQCTTAAPSASTTPGSPPPSPYMGVTFPNQSPAPYQLLSAIGGGAVPSPAASGSFYDPLATYPVQLGELSTGAQNDILYYKTASPMTSMTMTYDMPYTGPTSIVDPFLVYATNYSGGSTVYGTRVDITGTSATNTIALGSTVGDIQEMYFSGGTTHLAGYGRMRTEPYNYIVGHTYRVTMIADPTTHVISVRVTDLARPGESMFDEGIVQTGFFSTLSAYPGVINHYGGAIAINNFAFGPFNYQPMIPRKANSAYSFINMQGSNENTVAAASSDITTEPGAMLSLFPLTHIKHLRISADLADQASQNALASYGVDADCLISYTDTVAALNTFNSSLTNGCHFIEGPNEPNGSNIDPNWVNDVPTQLAAIRADATLGSKYIVGASIIDVGTGAAPFASISHVTPLLSSTINAYAVHPYMSSFPENTGYGGFSAGCGVSHTEDCGYYAAANWEFNEAYTQVAGSGLPGFASEGTGSYGSETAICGRGNVDKPTQSAYLERGIMYNWKLATDYNFPYKFIDDGNCADGFGSYGVISRLRNQDGTTRQFAPKPAYTSWTTLNNLIYDAGDPNGTFRPTPLTYGIQNSSPDVETLLIQESDGSYRLIIWSDKELWNFNANGSVIAGSEDALVSDAITLNFPASVTAVAYTQAPTTGIWTAGSTLTGAAITPPAVNQFPMVVAIYPAGVTATPAPVPSNIPTPGPTESPSPIPPSPLPTSTTGAYADNFDSDTVGNMPPGWVPGEQAWPFAVSTAGPHTTPNAFGESSGGNVGDFAFYSVTAAGSIETSMTFVASATTSPVKWMILSASRVGTITTGGTGNFFFVNPTSGNVQYNNATIEANLPTHTLISGHTYGAKLLVSGTTFEDKIWDITASASEGAYSSPVTTTHSITDMFVGIANTNGGAFSIDDFALAANGATLATLGSFPSPSPIPSPGYTFADNFDADGLASAPPTTSENNTRVWAVATTTPYSSPHSLAQSSSGLVGDYVYATTNYTNGTIEEEFTTTVTSAGSFQMEPFFVDRVGESFFALNIETGAITYSNAATNTHTTSDTLGQAFAIANLGDTYGIKAIMIPGTVPSFYVKAWDITAGETEPPTYSPKVSTVAAGHTIGPATTGVYSRATGVKEIDDWAIAFNGISLPVNAIPQSPYPSPSPVPTSTSLVYSNNFDGGSNTVGSLPAHWSVLPASAPFAVQTATPNTGANSFGEPSTGAHNDFAWYNLLYAPNIEMECTFVPTGTSTTPFDIIVLQESSIGLITPNGTGRFLFLNPQNGGITYNYPGDGGAAIAEGTLPGETYVVGHHYGFKLKVVGSSWQDKYWDITASATEPAYNTAVVITPLVTDMGIGFSNRATTTGTISLDDFAVAANGGTLPAIGSFP
jgi:hypothetical protein